MIQIFLPGAFPQRRKPSFGEFLRIICSKAAFHRIFDCGVNGFIKGVAYCSCYRAFHRVVYGVAGYVLRGNLLLISVRSLRRLFLLLTFCIIPCLAGILIHIICNRHNPLFCKHLPGINFIIQRSKHHREHRRRHRVIFLSGIDIFKASEAYDRKKQART